MLDATQNGGEPETLLEVNNIEVIYNHVILVLKGVSLTVSKGGITALLWGNALLVGCIAWAEKNVRLKAIYWSGLAVAFLAIGMDEAIVFHERIIDGCRQFFNAYSRP